MPQPVPAPVTSTPGVPGQPYSVTSDNTAPWRKLEANAGAADINTGRPTGDHFAAAERQGVSSTGKWVQA